jgi:hypothetical protein
MEITQPALPEQLLVHRTKTEPVAGVAETVTDDPRRYVCEHVDPQLIPEGELVTVPSPSPVFSIERRGSMRVVVDDVAVAKSLSVTLSTTV